MISNVNEEGRYSALFILCNYWINTLNLYKKNKKRYTKDTGGENL